MLRAIKARYPAMPVVMFTNSGDEEIAVEAMKAGLDDYVIKSPKHYFRLPLAVRSALKRARDLLALNVVKPAAIAKAIELEFILDPSLSLDGEVRRWGGEEAIESLHRIAPSPLGENYRKLGNLGKKEQYVLSFTKFIDKILLLFPHLTDLLRVQNPGIEKVAQFSITSDDTPITPSPHVHWF